MCAFPNCLKQLVTSETDRNEARVLGQIAHIAGEKPTAARYDPGMTDEQRNAAQNLIYLCPNDHGVIDTQPETYTTPTIIRWKVTHEESVRKAVLRDLAQLNFQELAKVCDAYISTPNVLDRQDYTLTEIRSKIAKNDLEAIEDDIQLGLSKAIIVSSFITAQNRLDPRFYEKLKHGFQSLYASYRYAGKSAVETYVELVDYARRHTSLRSYAPALAVVASLFEACEIFDQ